MEKGNISINSDNILPIIKKWLYSDTDIFVRELVSNGTDAVTKLKKLAEMGEADKKFLDKDYSVTVKLDKENKKIFIEDDGIGMTSDEVKKYINEIAFSGATDFIEKYNEKLGEEGQIIGHFGLGFYSAFMIAETVEIDTLSYKDGSTPVKWVCNGGIEYELTEGSRSTNGTTITLNVNEESEEFLNEFKLKEILNKYCSFMPVDIYFEDLNKEEPVVESDSEETVEVVEPTPINDKNPLWVRKPSECTDEDYLEFYRNVFHDFNEPLFWIHLNMDYPFNIKGILYFPKLKHELESIEGQVKLYNNQVFIADNIKEVIPEYLLLLKGVVDCPDLPLNVSRSFLQNDAYVAKLSSYIIKKVADKLNSQFKKDRENFATNWDNINQFIKYGCIRDKSFYDKVNKVLLFKNLKGEYITLEEYKEANKENFENDVYYVSDLNLQSQYVKLFKENNLDALLLETKLDAPFISYLEQYNSEFKFIRIDSDLSNVLKSEDVSTSEDEVNSLSSLFAKALNKEDFKVTVENLKTNSIASMLTVPEEARRMQEMSKMFAGMPMDMFNNVEETFILNENNGLVKKLVNADVNDETTSLICEHLYDLAVIGYKGLDDQGMTDFIERNNKLLEKLI